MNKQSTVFCKKFDQEKPALSKAPMPGPIGEIILNNISEEAWNEWNELQMKIINEERLDLSEKNAQERLFNAMINFLHIEDLVKS